MAKEVANNLNWQRMSLPRNIIITLYTKDQYDNNATGGGGSGTPMPDSGQQYPLGEN